jgi:hypothetical protein
MAQLYRLKKQNLALQLAPKPFASGGEGGIYEIALPYGYEEYVAKIIHPFKQNPIRVAKLQFLVDNQPPSAQHNLDEMPKLIWAEDLIVDEHGETVGFIMPRAKGEKLEILCAPNLPRNIDPVWRDYQRGTADAMRLRLKICANIAAVVAELHATNRYVVADLKPDNVLIRPDGSICLVDMDSIEILKNSQTLYAATVATPDYTPPEYYSQGVEPGKKTIRPEWDRFSLAVIFYRILLGIHPFAASCRAPYDNLNTLADKIEHGFFVHEQAKKDIFSIIPPPHQAFFALDEGLRFAFMRTFCEGHAAPALRVSAEHWAMLIHDSPLLLSHRPLPSATVNLPDLQKINWVEEAYAKAYEKYTKTAAQLSNSSPSPIKTIVFKVIGALFIVYMLSNLLATFYIVLPFPLLFIGLVIYFAMNKMKLPKKENSQRNAAKEKSAAPKALAQDISKYEKISDLKTLEENQYELFTRRHATKGALKTFAAELNIIEQIYKRRRREALTTQNKNLAPLIKKIEAQTAQPQEGGFDLDSKARELMQREQAEIENFYNQAARMLNNHPVFGQLKGQSPNQKMIEVAAWVNQQDWLTTEERKEKIQSLQAELAAMQTVLNKDIQQTQLKYQKLHQTLQGQAQQEQSKLQQYLNNTLQQIEKEAQFIKHLGADNFSQIAQERIKIQESIQEKERELQQLDYEIKIVRQVIARKV